MSVPSYNQFPLALSRRCIEGSVNGWKENNSRNRGRKLRPKSRGKLAGGTNRWLGQQYASISDTVPRFPQ